MSLAGKNWHDDKKPFRPNAGLTSYAKRAELRKQQEAIKEHEKELKEEKEAERQVRRQTEESLVVQSHGLLTTSQAHIQRIKDRRAAKDEKERYEKMAQKMHSKRVERLKRREKRNKLLHS